MASNKGRTFWDFLSENKIILRSLFFVFIILIALIALKIFDGADVKYNGLEILNSKEVDTSKTYNEKQSEDIAKPNTIINNNINNKINSSNTKNPRSDTNVVINANNAQIVTNNQTGGINTVVKTELAEPTIKILNWHLKNVKTNKIKLTLKRINRIENDSVYKNDIMLNYSCESVRPSVFFILKNDIDIIDHEIEHSGVNIFNEYKIDNLLVTEYKNIENGLYSYIIYSKKPIENPSNIISYQLK